jgi:small-conductance mechanosensitive channel
MPNDSMQQTTAGADASPAPDTQDFGASFGDLLDKAFSGHDAEGNAPEVPAEPTPPATSEDTPPPDPEPPKADPATPPEEDDAPKSMSPKAAEKWAALKAKTRAAEERAAELERRISEAESKGQNSSQSEQELASLREKITQYENRIKEQEQELAVSRVEATEEYRRTVVEPTRQLVAQLEALSKTYEVPVDELLRAVVSSEPGDKALESIAQSFGLRDQTRLFAIADHYQRIQEQRESIRQNAGEALKVVEENRKKQQEVALAEENKMWAQALDEGWEELKQSTPLFAELEKDPQKKVKADEIRQFVQSGQIINMAPKEKARLLYQGAAAPLLEAIAREFYTENKQLKERIESLQAVSPSLSSGSTETSTDSGMEDLDFEKLIEQKLRA